AALGSGSVHAYEDQAGLAIQLGYAHATESSLPHSGALLGLEASLGLSPIWSVRGLFSYGYHPAASNPLSALMLGGELLYLVDVLEVVPYFGAGIDAFGSWAHHAHAFSAEL